MDPSVPGSYDVLIRCTNHLVCFSFFAFFVSRSFRVASIHCMRGPEMKIGRFKRASPLAANLQFARMVSNVEFLLCHLLT
mmetsp:Transcript_11643/g.33625  ORF Transcript_11643/g.33625 Transcript_11643/m.33625 type:complete len:80 (+) Transcript_11643:1116-1355(+)